MIKRLIILMICALPYNGGAQINLVLNPSFEQYSACPDQWNQIKLANYWTAISDTFPSTSDSFTFFYCSAEYVNTCSDSIETSAPSNLYFYQYPRTGRGMAQVYMYYDNSVLPGMSIFDVYQRDYIQGRLKTALTLGKQYCVTFYVNLEEMSGYATDHIGAYFDDGSIDTTNNCGLPQTTHLPQVYQTGVIADTQNWTKVQGTFMAEAGNERFITIGNFFDFASTSAMLLTYAGFVPCTFYLVDDVSVIATDAVAYAGNDTNIAAGGSVYIGTHDGYLPCKWYKNGVLIDSNTSGFTVNPFVNTTYVMELDVCGILSYDTMNIHVGDVSVATLGMQHIKLYPNPATHELHIDHAPGCEVSVTNILGQQVLQKAHLAYKEALDISMLPSGVYNLQIIDPQTGDEVVRRWVKD